MTFGTIGRPIRFDERKHRRIPRGLEGGGRFATKGGEKSKSFFRGYKSLDGYDTPSALMLLYGSGKHRLQISDEHRQSVNMYTESGYVVINRALRGILQPKEKIVKVISDIDSFLENHNMPKSVVCYRGMTNSMAEMLKRLNPGDVIIDRGYHSVSFNRRLAEGFSTVGGAGPSSYVVLVPKGAKAFPVAELSTHKTENEILIARGSRFRYLGIQGGAPVFRLEPGRIKPAFTESVSFVSPNTGNLNLEEAEKNLRSKEHNEIKAAFEEIDARLGLKSESRSVIGAWSDGAENSVMSVAATKDFEKVRLSAAMKGYIARQKQVLVFDHNGNGTDFLASVEIAGGSIKIDRIHADLLRAGLEFHTIETSPGGSATVYVFGSDDKTLNLVGDFAAKYKTEFNLRYGRGEFIGTEKTDGTDAEQREDARRVYREIVEAAAERAGNRAARLWRDLLDRFDPPDRSGWVGIKSGRSWAALPAGSL